jgi:bla regulator protein blaR1
MLNHIWQSTLFATAAGALTLAFRGNRAQVRYWIWFAASMKFLAPLSILLALGSHIDWGQTASAKAGIVSVAVSQISRPFTEPMPIGAVADPKPASNALPAALICIWACGFAGIGWRRFGAWRKLGAAVRNARSVPLHFAIEVRSSSEFCEPGVVGIYRPVVLLPEGIEARFTSTELQAVFAHEICHVRRRDNLTAALHMAVEMLFWFHPLVWWVGARLIEERERACDEEVLRLGNDPQLYAESILKVCEFSMEPMPRFMAGVSGGALARRIEEIMTHRNVRALAFRKKALLGLAAAAAIAGPLIIGSLNPPLIRAQSARAAGNGFELASIKPCAERSRSDLKMGPAGGTPTVSPGRLNTGCAALAAQYPMAGLIQRAYGRLGLGRPVSLGTALPVTGGPAWIYSDYYVINAQAPGGATEETMEGPMLQALLEDRFKLKVHRESRQVPIYALTVPRGGAKLQPVKEGGCVRIDRSHWPLPPMPAGKKYCQDVVGGRNGPNTAIDADEQTLDYFCRLLSLVMDRPVVDRTGLVGKYTIHLKFAVDQTTPNVLDGGPPSDDPVAPSIFTVVQQELGLKLEATKGSRDFLVIDHVEKPSAN